ncbi:MAG: oligosaccharide flippase family protein [Chitinophagaceae bacterium]|nr:oligosaccharide flippase family protein [Chitinophagaceae bacterium]MCW5928533.1 oligosaccharide flippase family protein [Chitinophagaceae bacterium]
MSLLKKYSYWIDSGKYTSIQKFSTLAMGVVSFMLLTRILGVAGFGSWGLFLAIASVAETARMALVKNAFIRFIHQTDQSEHSHIQSAAFILTMGVSLLLCVLFFFISDTVAYYLNAPDLAAMLKWYALTIFVSGVFTHLEIMMSANMNFKGICWTYVVRQGILLMMILLCFILNRPVSPVVLAVFYFVSILISLFPALYFSYRYIQMNYRGTYRNWVLSLWKYGRFVFGNNLSSLLFRSTDTFMASRFFGIGISAYYNASLRISNLVDMPSQVMGDILFPKAARLNRTDSNEVKNMYEKAVGASLVFSIPALLFLLLIPETILRVLAGKEFVVAATVLRITAFFGFILPFLKQFGTIMDATGSPATNFRVMFFAFFINIGFNLAGIYLFGMIGPALGTAFTYLLIFVITQIVLSKRFNISVVNVFRYTFGFYKILLFNRIPTMHRS